MSKSAVRISDIGKNEYEEIRTDGKTIFLCGTDLAYDDAFCEACYELLEKFGYDSDDCLNDGRLPRLRDALIAAFEKEMNCKFVPIHDYY